MADPFAPPPGDAGGVRGAAGTLGTVSGDLSSDVGKLKTAVGTAISDWHAPRAEDFKHAAFGIQVQAALTMDAAHAVAGIVGQFGQALQVATGEVANYKAQADRARTDLAQAQKKQAAGDPLQLLAVLDAEGRIHAAEQKALGVKSDLTQLAGRLAAAVDAETGKVVPFSSFLSPAEIRRAVDFQMGVTGLSGRAANGTLSSAQAWNLMASATLQGNQVLDLVEDNKDGELAGGPVTSLTTDIGTLQDLLDAAREDGIAPTRYAGVLAQYWVVKAADAAGINLDAWDPSKGVGANTSTISAVYTFYGKLFLNDPKLQWAGMANMIGPSFAAGFMDLDMMKRIAGDLAGPVNDVPGWAKPLLPPELRALGDIANMSAGEFRWYEDKFLAMQKHIFFDQGAMHEAYSTGGINSISEMRAAGLIDDKAMTAWQDVDSGNPQLISAGNTLLLDREQNQIINSQYDQMRNHDGPVGPAMTYLMTVVGSASIPGTKTPGEYSPLTVSGEAEAPGPFWPVSHTTVKVTIKTPLPDFNVSNKGSRWDYVTKDTLPAYQRLLREHPEQARQIVATPINQRIDEQRLAKRWPQLVDDGITNWDVSVDGGIGWGPW